MRSTQPVNRQARSAVLSDVPMGLATPVLANAENLRTRQDHDSLVAQEGTKTKSPFFVSIRASCGHQSHTDPRPAFSGAMRPRRRLALPQPERLMRLTSQLPP
jgi:hypothetical protein